PADAHALDARRQPQVLDGAAHAPAQRVRLRGRAEHRLAARARVAGDAQVERRLEDPLEAIGEVLGAARLLVARRLALAAAQEALADARAPLAVAHHDEVPR